MKKILLAVMLTLVTGTTSLSWAATSPKHRYQPGIEAFSDTTSIDTAVPNIAIPDDADDDDDDDKAYSDYSMRHSSDPLDYLGNVFGKGGLVVIVVLCILFGLTIILAPFILAFFLIRYCIRRHNDRVRLAEKAMESGQPIPEGVRGFEVQSDEYLVKRGLRNAFLGIGIWVMFAIWGADFLAGIGALVCFYGVGQAVIGSLPAIKEYFASRKNKVEE